MRTPICAAIRLTKVVFVTGIGWLTSCQSERTIHILSYGQGIAMGRKYVRHYNPQRKQANWQGPPATFTRFRRTNPAAAPMVAGSVAIQEENGKLTPLPGAIITIDDAHTFAGETGTYARIVGPGRHYVRVGGVGLLWSEVPPLHVERGDSIHIIVHLLPEFRPTMN